MSTLFTHVRRNVLLLASLAIGTACGSGDAPAPATSLGGAGGIGGASGSGGSSTSGGSAGIAGASGGASGAGAGAGASAGTAGSGGVVPDGGAGGASGNAGSSGAGTGGQGGPAAGGQGGTSPSTDDGPTGHAFDTSSGRLLVDYAGFFSKHDIVYTKPDTNPLHGLTVGNGRMGAMVWPANGLTMQVSNVDTSPQTELGAGLVNLYTTPAIETATAYQARLSLYDGTLTFSYDTNRTVTIMGSPGSEVMGIHIEDGRTGVSAVTVDLSLWADLGYWPAVVTYADAASAGLSRGQTETNHFGYTLAASVEGAAFTTQVVDPKKVRLTITPGASYTIWLACATRMNAPSNDSVAQAKKLLADTKQQGYAAVLPAYKSWWHDFWAKSFVQYSGAEGDYLENLYYLSTYMIASGGFGNYPFHFINGVFRATGDKTKWSNAYWYWNQRDVYHSFLASNHAGMVNVFNNLYARNVTTLTAYTQTRYGIAGVWVPETMGWDGSASGTINSDFTKDILSTGTEAALNMYAQYQYTGDESYLTKTVYPFVREAVEFYRGKLSYDATAGKYYMAVSNAHETYWEVKNAITDLAAVRSLFPIAIALSQSLSQDAALRPEWQKILGNLIAYPTDGTVYLPHQPPIAPTHNGENVAAELIWPYGVTGIGAPDYAMALATWKARPSPYGNVWANDAIQAARLGLGDETYQGLKLMLHKYQNYPNGMTNNDNGVFEYLGVHLIAMNEALLQSYSDKIRVFPAPPSDTKFIGRFTLAAKGGFWVSSERESEIKYVGLKSLLGSQALVVNPWGTEAVQVRRASDNSIAATSSAAEISFATAKDGIYVVERTAKPLSSYQVARISGQLNNGSKALAGTAATIGNGNVTTPDTGKYEAEKATLVACNASDDAAASGFSAVINTKQGSSITFSNVIAGSAIDVRYCTMNNPGKLALYVNNVKAQDVTFPNTNSWTGTYATVTVTAPIPQGASVKLQYDAGGSGANIDFVQIR
jgi:hypothetical protein